MSSPLFGLLFFLLVEFWIYDPFMSPVHVLQRIHRKDKSVGVFANNILKECCIFS